MKKKLDVLHLLTCVVGCIFTGWSIYIIGKDTIKAGHIFALLGALPLGILFLHTAIKKCRQKNQENKNQNYYPPPPSTDVKTENDTSAEQGNQPERAGE